MSQEAHKSAAATIAARCAVVTLSDTRNEQTDKSGARMKELLAADGHSISHYQVIPDDPARLRSLLETLLANAQIDCIITNGGTGITRRDQTVPAITSLIDIPLPGFGELFRALSFEQIGSAAMLSRAIGGVAKGKLLFALPGSTKAVELAMTKLIIPELRHLLGELRR